ncbi:TPA_asm: TRAP transporter large permease [Salmonella enterica subsp. salamae serovar 42:z:1,5]|uniref:TRAP transporter large permease protein n=1 Tax=Salmonella enterica subsp. salamae serovar 42:z:1,5 TaxID=1967617 RepID=A0A735V6R0_SALER|nr:TRAP transporter large permease [Salmonella enterica]ECC9542060.1 TRAP transporter large permease [Salmonella enterica subsp. salamae]EHJ5091619.1 TRAP transporter large permease [Salmonella enterica subsp. salamae serovar 16:m,t:-]MBA2992563.1 TRAP transporter large permease [Salmonella enterica subsp. salamae serovar 47:z:e,n,x,z15]HAE7082736.1 TRAP transporter large permease [Salmonella enterica subsp. salamae serovar 42:z:1,5]HER1246843.1 TRAP transporter large permease [Salmonella ente
MIDPIFASCTLIAVFVVLLAMGAPIGICIVIASFSTMMLVLPFDISMFATAQKMFSSLDSFALLAVPFFVLSGVIMNSGGIAARLVNFAKLFTGKLPGSLSYTNIVGNMMFGAISGSAIAASTSIGGVMVPMSAREGYDRGFAAAVNIASAPTGMLIPPTTAFILYALASGGTSIAALFAGGLVAGVLWGIGCMLVTLVVAKRRNYRVFFTVQKGMALKVAIEAIPSLLLIVIIVGGIVQGIFTAIEASAIAVVYTLLLTMVFYRTLKIKDLPSILLQTVIMTGVIMFLLATSSAMSFSMSITNIPAALSDMILGISANKLVILLVITVFLLIIGAFMDIGPAILIFTPILLPIMTKLGVDPVHFGIIMIYNLAIGTITPPVGSGLYVGASVGKVKVEDVIKPLLPFYGAIIGVLLLITYIPEITLFLPRLLGIM